jgi:TolB-like protein
VDGMVEEIITALSYMRWLFVIARSSSFTYKDKAVDVRQVGRELGVRYVLEGSVRKSTDRVRVTCQLIDAATRAHISAMRFDSELKDIFDLQEQVAASVAGATEPSLVRKKSSVLDASQLTILTLTITSYGRTYAHNWTRQSNDEALRLLTRAIELDPNFASAYGQATWCYCLRKINQWGTFTVEEVIETARLSWRAVEVGKEDAYALCWAAYSIGYIGGEVEQGAALMDRALTLNPNLARAWNLSGWMKNWLGEPEIAIEHQARAMRLSPLDPVMFAIQNGMAAAHFFAGRFQEAASWAEKSLRELPNNPGWLAVTRALAGEIEAAQNAMVRYRQAAPDRRLSNLMDRLPPYRRPEDAARLIEGFRKAGLPE